MITYNREFFVVGHSEEDISDCKGLRGVAMATKFLAKIGQKNHKNGHNFSCMQHIHAEFGFAIGLYHQGIHL